MKNVVNGMLSMVTVASALVIMGTFVSSPNATSELGLPTIRFGTQDVKGTEKPRVYLWPADNIRDESSVHALPFTRTMGLVVTSGSATSEEHRNIKAIIETEHASTTMSDAVVSSLTKQLNESPHVQLVWSAAPPQHDGALNIDGCAKMTAIVNDKIVAKKKELKTYEIETAVLTDQLEKQWTEQLLRQSTEDLHTLTLMRARAEQDVRLRLAKAHFDNARIRMEGLSSVEQARLDYLSSLNAIMNKTRSANLLPVLERHSLFQKNDPNLHNQSRTKDTKE